MNKFLSFFVALSAFVLLFTACSKSPDKLLDRKDGKWDVVITTVIIMDAGYSSTAVHSGTFFFEENKYTLMLDNGMTATGTWAAEAKKVTLVTNAEVMELEVIKSGRKEQEWRHAGFNPDTKMEYELTYELKR
jgi:hypothetical protein